MPPLKRRRSHSSATGSTVTGDYCHIPHPSLCQLGDGFHVLRSATSSPHQLPYIFHILLGFFVQVYLLSVLKFLEKSEASISVAEDVSEEVTNDRLKAGAKEETDSLNRPKNGHMGGATAEERARLETEEPGSPRGHTTEDAFDIFGKSVASEIRQTESAHMQKVAKLRIQQVSLDVQMDVVAQASSSSQKHSQQK
ncbi:hypothetical protein AGOR_G00237640 [Albula goreensis]|uniref:Uncharacterized protein n=1 Tax=Albula goreensis TaxID=1534307 RepID=A0A8T3CI22_9TELE|nr:hypothetical protein AGOR_G00237640 [Albula goreensis]